MTLGENITCPAGSMSMQTLLYERGYVGIYMAISYADTVALENYNINTH